MISPCFTSPAGIAFFTAQIITSPTCATFRLNLPLLLEPRSTLMHIACLAPVLSAMSRYVCCWIMVALLHLRLLLWHSRPRLCSTEGRNNSSKGLPPSAEHSRGRLCHNTQLATVTFLPAPCRSSLLQPTPAL